MQNNNFMGKESVDMENFYIVLHELKNGLESLDSIPFEEKPSDEVAQKAAEFYGAKRFEVICK